jgi:hypothetical protein
MSGVREETGIEAVGADEAEAEEGQSKGRGRGFGSKDSGERHKKRDMGRGEWKYATWKALYLA